MSPSLLKQAKTGRFSGLPFFSPALPASGEGGAEIILDRV